MNLKNVLESVNLCEGDSERMNCPSCGGYRTFTISKRMGSLLWNCYKASCDCSGKSSARLTSQDIRTRLALSRGEGVADKPVPFTVPEHVVKRSTPLLDQYVQEYRLQDADVHLDIVENRAVFLIRDLETDEVLGAVGRSLIGDVPKWKRYDKCRDLMYFTNTNKECGILVEDCLSAVACENAGYTGIALLGTTMHESRIVDLMPFKEIVICLDKDASLKSLKIKKMLDAYVNCRVVLLTDDLKYFPPADVQGIISQSLRPSL